MTQQIPDKISKHNDFPTTGYKRILYSRFNAMKTGRDGTVRMNTVCLLTGDLPTTEW